MKKQKKRTKRYETATAAVQPTAQATEPVTRRTALSRYRNWGIGAAVVGTAGWFVVEDVQATVREHDLTRIGNGIPTVVQIHDPNCSICAALQKETRAAVKGFDASELQFLVANIKDARGSKLAADNGVPHVTLLLFDGDGKRQDILRGPNDRSVLEPRFRQFVQQVGG